MKRQKICKKKNKIGKLNTFFKRVFDLVFSFLGVILFSPIIFLLFFISTFDTKENGFFLQNRVGRKGILFKIIKIRTMKSNKRTVNGITITDPRVTKVGKVLRKSKLDELPQIYNVFLGQMSFVGPRPNFAEKYNKLPKDEKEILCSIRPGITGPASIKYKNEEGILDKATIFKDKVRINIDYINNYNIMDDIKYVYKTLF